MKLWPSSVGLKTSLCFNPYIILYLSIVKKQNSLSAIFLHFTVSDWLYSTYNYSYCWMVDTHSTSQLPKILELSIVSSFDGKRRHSLAYTKNVPSTNVQSRWFSDENLWTTKSSNHQPMYHGKTHASSEHSKKAEIPKLGVPPVIFQNFMRTCSMKSTPSFTGSPGEVDDWGRGWEVVPSGTTSRDRWRCWCHWRQLQLSPWWRESAKKGRWKWEFVHHISKCLVNLWI